MEDPFECVVRCGFELAAAAPKIRDGWGVRIGVTCGPVVGGVVGADRRQFDIWGDTVNVAARLTGPGRPGTICMSEELYVRVRGVCEGRHLGEVVLKGKGTTPLVECTPGRDWPVYPGLAGAGNESGAAGEIPGDTTRGAPTVPPEPGSSSRELGSSLFDRSGGPLPQASPVASPGGEGVSPRNMGPGGSPESPGGTSAAGSSQRVAA